MKRQRATRFSIRAFSLVEVLIAVGIVATVMLGLVGVMPVGMSAIQDAQHNQVKARIVQEIISDVQSANWAGTNPSGGVTLTDTLNLQQDLLGDRNARYYSSQGARINPNAPRVGKEPPPVPIYAAMVEVAPGIGDNPTLMTSDKNNAYKFLKILQIYVEHTPGGRPPAFKSDARVKFVERFPFVLANMGSSEAVRNND